MSKLQEPDAPKPPDRAPIALPERPLERRKPSRHPHQVWFALAAVLIALGVLWIVKGVIGAFILGALLAFLMTPAVDWLADHRVPRAIGILALMVAGAGLLALIVILFVPLLTTESRQLIAQLPSIASQAQQRLTNLKSVSIFGQSVNLKSLADQVGTHVNEFLLGQFGNAIGIGLQAVGVLGQLLLMLIVAFLMAFDARGITSEVRSLVPIAYRPEFESIWADLKRMLYGYIRGQLLIAALLGVLSGIAVLVLGLPFALALGLLAGITALVPYLGPFLGALPAIVVGLSISPEKAIEVAIAYLVISNVILNLVYPRVVGGAVRLPALLVIIAFIAGFAMGGILGMFVAVPVAAAMRILHDHLYPRVYTAA